MLISRVDSLDVEVERAFELVVVEDLVCREMEAAEVFLKRGRCWWLNFQYHGFLDSLMRMAFLFALFYSLYVDLCHLRMASC